MSSLSLLRCCTFNGATTSSSSSSSIFIAQKTIRNLYNCNYHSNSNKSAALSVKNIFLTKRVATTSSSSSLLAINDRRYATTSTITQDNKVKKFTNEDETETLSRIQKILDDEDKSGDIVPIFKKALLHGHKIAIKDSIGEYSYNRLYMAAKKLSYQISNIWGSGSNNRVAFLCPNDVMYPLMQWSIWFSGQIAVPLSSRHPPELLKYLIKDSQCNVILTTPEYESIMKPISDNLKCVLITVDHTFIPEFDTQNSWLDPKYQNVLFLNDQVIIEGVLNSDYYTKKDAMILYTSGTTGSPKGVVLSHKNVNSQINCLTSAWQFSNKDSLLHVLPLHHVHGCVNALMCPLSVGGKVIMHERFDSHNVWSALLGINIPAKDRANTFMGVPTIYNFLIDEYNKIFAKNSRMIEYIENHCKKNIRLMVSGSVPLPVTTFNRWLEISGHKLLERYGMTEIGMALSNPYIEDKIRQRKSGCVGLPLPGVEVRIVDNDKKVLFECKGEKGKGFWSTVEQPVYSGDATTKKDEKPIIGELQVKGDNVFKQYYNRQEETKNSFDGNYFKTGDIVSYEGGVFKIMGRSSVDIIKTGGYKVSALEIETHLLTHPNIKDVAIVGVDDVTWGQKIVAVISLRDNTELDLETLKVFCSEKIASYSMPAVLKIVKELPRNAMGKVNKKDLVRILFSQTEQKQQQHQQQQQQSDKQEEPQQNQEPITNKKKNA